MENKLENRQRNMFLSHWFEFSGIDKIIAPPQVDQDANETSDADVGAGNEVSPI